MSRILAFDTSAEVCSVCLLDGEKQYLEVEQAPRKQAQLLLPMIQQVLQEANLKLSDLDALAFGRGPGSFTGLRIAAGVAQGLSFGADLPVYAESNLKAMARQCAEKDPNVERCLAVFDARMDQVYAGVFSVSSGEIQALGEEVVCAPEDLYERLGIELTDGKRISAIGSGLVMRQRFAEPLQRLIFQVDELATPSAEDIAYLALKRLESGEQGIASTAIQPAYVRNEVTWKKLPGRE